MIQAVGASTVLLARTVGVVRREGVSLREVGRQIVELGASSAPLIISGLAFFGAVAVAICNVQARKYTGSITVVGAAYFELIIREFAPMFVALLAASRAGAATSAELASMAVNEQLEAMQLSAANPLRELVAPRVLASLVALPVLMVLGTVAASLSAAFTATVVYGADGTTFIDPRFVDWGDVSSVIVKAVLCGLYIPLATSARGLKAVGGAQAVGDAVTQGVIDACTGCLLLDFLVAATFLIIGL